MEMRSDIISWNIYAVHVILQIQIFSYRSAADVRALILKQNEQAKIDVKAEFSKLKDVKVSYIEYKNTNIVPNCKPALILKLFSC